MRTHGSIQNPELRAILKSEGLRQVAFMPLAPNAAWFKASTVPTASGTSSVTTLLAAAMTAAYAPGWPVVPTVTCIEDTHDTWTAMSAVVTGIDQFGDFCKETITGANSPAKTWTATCVNAYQSLISVVITITGDVAAADRYTIGYNKTYGVGYMLGAATDLICKLFNGSADAGTLSLPYQTYVVAGTPDAAKELVLLMRPGYYLS
jgi:hypothetical protein